MKFQNELVIIHRWFLDYAAKAIKTLLKKVERLEKENQKLKSKIKEGKGNEKV